MKKVVQNRELVVPGQMLVSASSFNAGSGTYEKNKNIYSSVIGLINIKDNRINVNKINGEYMPKKGDYVIGKIIDMNFSNWFINIESAFDAGLQIREASNSYLDTENNDMTYYYNYNDYIKARIIDITKSGKISLTMKDRSCKKLIGGIVLKLNTNKISRIIGKEGSMISMIKEETKTEIIACHNGLVWVKGEAENIKKVKGIIELIEKESHIKGLTDKIKKILTKKGEKK